MCSLKGEALHANSSPMAELVIDAKLPLDFGGWKYQVSLRFVSKRHEATVGRHVSIKLNTLIGVPLSVQASRKMFSESSCPYSSGH